MYRPPAREHFSPAYICSHRWSHFTLSTPRTMSDQPTKYLFYVYAPDYTDPDCLAQMQHGVATFSIGERGSGEKRLVVYASLFPVYAHRIVTDHVLQRRLRRPSPVFRLMSRSCCVYVLWISFLALTVLSCCISLPTICPPVLCRCTMFSCSVVTSYVLPIPMLSTIVQHP